MSNLNAFIELGVSAKEFSIALKKFNTVVEQIKYFTLYEGKKDKKVRRIIHINNTTKKQKIRKKQLTRMKKIVEKLEERTKDNDIQSFED